MSVPAPSGSISAAWSSLSESGTLFRLVSEVLSAIQAGVFHPIVGWQCKECPFRSKCWAWGWSLWRPPLALERLTERPHGHLVFELAHPRADGTTHLRLEPLEQPLGQYLSASWSR